MFSDIFFLYLFCTIYFVLVTDAKSTISVKEYCHSDSERGSLSSLEMDIRPPMTAEYLTKDNAASLHYRSLQNQALPVVFDVPARPKNLQCHVTTDIPSRKRFHTAPREKHRVGHSKLFIGI